MDGSVEVVLSPVSTESPSQCWRGCLRFEALNHSTGACDTCHKNQAVNSGVLANLQFQKLLFCLPTFLLDLLLQVMCCE